jgi:putative Holliday junction resolvase
MRVLAVDHGTARCGCAISDPTGTLARPLPVIDPCEARRVAELVAEHGVELVVVGLPVGLHGEEGTQAEFARAFADDVAGLVEVPVETHDERFTTAMAQASARGGADAAEDSLAAAHLLESFLASCGEDR